MTEERLRQRKLTFALWTEKVVEHLIQGRSGVKRNTSSVGRLSSWRGLTPQRRLKRAYPPRAEDAPRWLKTESPRLSALANPHGALILFGDETGVRSDHHICG